MRKIGINLYSRDCIELEEYIQIIKDLGFEATFCAIRPLEKMLKTADLLAKAGIEFETVHAPFRSASSMWVDEEEGEAVYASLADSIDMCVKVGAPICVMHLSSSSTPPPPTDLGRARYAKLVDYAISKGIIIAFENTHTLANLAWAFEEFAATDNVGFCYDSGHEAALSPGRHVLPIFGSRLVCTHIHDNNLLQDQHILPFDGKIDFERVARQIRECGYKGNLMMEVMGRKFSYETIPTMEYLEKAARAAKRLREMIDG